MSALKYVKSKKIEIWEPLSTGNAARTSMADCLNHWMMLLSLQTNQLPLYVRLNDWWESSGHPAAWEMLIIQKLFLCTSTQSPSDHFRKEKKGKFTKYYNSADSSVLAQLTTSIISPNTKGKHSKWVLVLKGFLFPYEAQRLGQWGGFSPQTFSSITASVSLVITVWQRFTVPLTWHLCPWGPLCKRNNDIPITSAVCSNYTLIWTMKPKYHMSVGGQPDVEPCLWICCWHLHMVPLKALLLSCCY